MKSAIKTAAKTVADAIAGKPAGEIAAEPLLKARKDRDEKAARLANLERDLETAYQRGNRESVAKLEAEIPALKKDLRFADASVANLEDEAREALKAEAEADRRMQHEETLRERSVVATLLREKYPEHAGEIAKILDRLEVLELRIRQVNQDLPVGTAPIDDLEYSVRRPRGSEPVRPLAETVNLPGLIGGDLNIWPAGTIQ